MSELPKAAVERLIKNASGLRVSATAVDAMLDILEDIAVDIGTQANQLAHHAGRKTVTGKDIHVAART